MRPNELHPIVAAAQAGDQEAYAQVVEVVRPQVISMRNRYSNGLDTERLNDLEGSLWVGIAEAVYRFDASHEKAKSFQLVCWYRMRHHAMEWLSDNVGSLPMPRKAFEEAGKMQDALYEDNPQQDPTAVSKEDWKKYTNVGYAQQAIQARRKSYEMKEEHHQLDEGSPEDMVIEEHEQMVHRHTLNLVDWLDDIDQSEWWAVVTDFTDEMGLGRDIAENIMQAKEMGL